MKTRYLGEFEQLVLLAILQLKDNAYGMTIRRELDDSAKRPASLGSVYTTLDRLEEKGFISSWIGEPTLERGGRAKKFFRITLTGTTALRRSIASRDSMLVGLEAIREGTR